MNRVIEGLIGTTSVAVVITGMAAFDNRVRGHVESVLNGEGMDQLSFAGLHAQRFVNFLTATASSYSSEHTAFVYFGAGALLLVVLMLRT